MSVMTVEVHAQNAAHMASGDVLLSDGGWATVCEDAGDDCHDHVAPVKHHSDHSGVDHHHHFSETVSAPLPMMARACAPAYADGLDLRPAVVLSLSGLPPSSLDQPPRD